MQLTWDEVRAAMREGDGQTPDDFIKEMAEYMPQGVIEQLMEEIVELRFKAGMDIETVVNESTGFMVGFHTGFHVGLRAGGK